jgi:hypothetical protein
LKKQYLELELEKYKSYVAAMSETNAPRHHDLLIREDSTLELPYESLFNRTDIVVDGDILEIDLTASFIPVTFLD